MITKLVFVIVTTIAIGIGYHEYLGGQLAIFGKTCHQRFGNPFKYMATKTPYLSNGLDAEAALGDPFQNFHGGVCEPVLTWHLIRHGTRNPGAKVIKTMKKLLPGLRDQILEGHKKGKGKLCEAELAELESWTLELFPVETKEKFLVPQGQKELLGISKRFKQRFPQVYASQYHNDTYKFQYTKTQRAEDSAKHFTKGIFGETQAEGIYFPIAVNAHPVLRFYKECKKWKKEVDKNPEAYQERVKFETSKTFTDMLTKLQERLGLDSAPTLEEVEIMYLTCAFESAWNPSSVSPWCNVFDEYDFQILDYRQDVEYYWIDGYGYKLTYEQACPTIEDVVLKLSSKVEDPSAPSVVAYFTHSGTVLKVIARLGLFNDSVPLLGTNFDHHRNSRKWRTSIIDPFATNLAFVLYRCSQNYKVGLLFKEKPIAQPLCDGKYLCPLDEFKTAMDPFIRNCDLTRLCKV